MVADKGKKPKIGEKIVEENVDQILSIEKLQEVQDELEKVLAQYLEYYMVVLRYTDKYYANAIASGEFTKLAYYNDNCVGSIACRLEEKEDGVVCVYIMTLGVLAPYRGLGIGRKLLNHVIDLCSKQNIGEIYLHVQTKMPSNFTINLGLKSPIPSETIIRTSLHQIATSLRSTLRHLKPINRLSKNGVLSQQLDL
ncbi:hypothetical protein L6452_32751 [Arctium lappa]|uniref:Uncharacterized protein n=1 Tax=Arctium lappa TaxID=4217 RepID=A0ACB8Z640_ARCLA|nr:hypothetical protein L6452_32751 [Arctium lappa]